MKRIVWSGIWLAVMFSLASCSPKALHVQQAWVRPANAGNNGAAYFTIQNPSKTEDMLLSASSSIAEAAELHLSSMNAEGTMTMEPQASVAVPAGENVEFKPGGLHVMLVNLQQDLKVGDTFQLDLKFQVAGTQTITVEVKEP
jgi:copper(I)-binding protein